MVILEIDPKAKSSNQGSKKFLLNLNNMHFSLGQASNNQEGERACSYETSLFEDQQLLEKKREDSF